MKIIASFLSFGLISVFVGVSGISAWAVTISGTVEIVDLESGEGIPLVGARVSALDMDDRAVDADISNDAGEFSLDVSEEIDLHILVRGPVFPDEYVDTYGPFFNSGTEDIEDMKGRIVRKSDLAGILALDGPPIDEREGIVMGVVEARAYSREGISDLVPVAGATVRIMEPDGREIEAPVVYMDENGEWDLSLQMTSSKGAYVIYNINIGVIGELEAKDVKLAGSKRLYFFPTWDQVRLYPHTSEGSIGMSQEKVTVVYFEGWGIEIGGENSNVGCFISAIAGEFGRTK